LHNCRRPGPERFGKTVEGPGDRGHGSLPACLLSKGAGQEGFSHSCRTRDEKILVRMDPLTGGETENHRLFDASRSSVVDVLQGGLKFQFGLFEETFETFVLFPGPLAIN